MTAEGWTALSDVVLGVGTFALAFSLKPETPFLRTWMALFIALAGSAFFGALYHGIDSLKNQNIWTLTSSTSTASIFLFFMTAVCMTRPAWAWLAGAWPIAAMFGFVVGGMIAHGPFYYVSIVAGVMSLAAAIVLRWSPLAVTRGWIYTGLVITVVGLILQARLGKEGIFNNNVIFHIFQFIANLCFFFAARAGK